MPAPTAAAELSVAINGWFLARQHTGSGQYTAHLLACLGEQGITASVAPPPEGGNVTKLLWEQRGWPRQAAVSGAHLWHSPYFALPLRRSRPAVVTIHDLIPVLLPAYRGSPLARAYTCLQLLACRSAAAILVDSECSRRDVMRVLKVPPERVHTIYLGVDHPDPPQTDEAAPLDVPYVLYVGGLDVRKNVPLLIAAFGEIAEQFPNLALAIVGEPRSASARFPDARRAAKPLGHRVRFLGWVSEEEKFRLYRHAALFAYPSLYEGFGLNPLEALASGCPVVCSNASSLPEVVGDAALLADARQATPFAQAMAAALCDPAPLRARGPARAAQFSWRRCAEQTAQAYREAAT
ncbi:MAG TPA: glycosyltransferase family 1 protein [Chloroflexota bacterium]|nr:glycosyltransferase family 1 protein [Chloroflexota bacterium]